MNDRQPCQTTVMRCVAFAMPGKTRCECHMRNRELHPRELTRAERMAKLPDPMNPWDLPPWDEGGRA